MDSVKSILCFGDSNTFGSDPAKNHERHPYEARWTTRLQKLLGEGYHVIAEGMGGRTTVFDDPLLEGRNGLAILPVLLHSHRPLDLVILSLGTNDCKLNLNNTPGIIAKGMERLILAVRGCDNGPGNPPPKVLLVSPIHMGPGIKNSRFGVFDDHSRQIVQGIAEQYRELASQYGCAFFDAAKAAGPGPDQLHMDAASHASLAQALAPMVRDLLQEERP